VRLNLIIISLVVAALSGCGLIPRTGEPSTALQIADAMDIPAKDMSREKYNKLLEKSGGSSVNMDSMVAGALSLDPAMIILGGSASPPPSQMVQVVAWVPVSEAATGEEAVKLVENINKRIIRSFYDENFSDQDFQEKYLKPKVIGLPYGDLGFKSPVQLFQLMSGYVPELQQAPSFMRAQEKVWGPLYLGAIVGGKGVDSYSEAAPEWIYIYDPGKYKERPRAIYNKGRPELFVEPD